MSVPEQPLFLFCFPSGTFWGRRAPGSPASRPGAQSRRCQSRANGVQGSTNPLIEAPPHCRIPSTSIGGTTCFTTLPQTQEHSSTRYNFDLSLDVTELDDTLNCDSFTHCTPDITKHRDTENSGLARPEPHEAAPRKHTPLPLRAFFTHVRRARGPAAKGVDNQHGGRYG